MKFMKFFKIYLIPIIVFFAFMQVNCISAGAYKQNKVKVDNKLSEQVEDNTLQTLHSILDLKSNLEKQLKEKKRELKQASLDTEKQQIKAEIQHLSSQLQDCENDFTRIAAKIDPTLFRPNVRQKTFDWQEELTVLFRPIFDEIKLLTAKIRKQSQLNMRIEHYNDLIPETKQAVKNLQELIKKVKDRRLKKQLEKEEVVWATRTREMEDKLKIAKMQLEQLLSTKTTFKELLQNFIRKFYKTRGVYLLITIFSFISIIVLCWRLHKWLKRILPGYRQEHIPLRLRIFDLSFRVFTVLFAVTGLFVVLYTLQDWVLFSFFIIFFIALVWTARLSIMRFWNQGVLILNIGSVREGERVVIDGIPWYVRKINVFSIFENPDLGVTLRLPIGKLLDMESRPFRRNERWFPCKEDDWVILSDGTFGKVVSLSNDIIEVIQRGGARKTYKLSDFMSLTPLNLSCNFRIEVTFGISYDLQSICTNRVLNVFRNYIILKLKTEGYGDNIKNVLVEFNEAASSSLDIFIAIDCDGNLAPLYNRLKRAIQKWCVEVCNKEDWEIPFTQITVHTAD